jgi:energy-coupling factor transporter ATP-binding protein EcfA2
MSLTSSQSIRRRVPQAAANSTTKMPTMAPTALKFEWSEFPESEMDSLVLDWITPVDPMQAKFAALVFFDAVRILRSEHPFSLTCRLENLNSMPALRLFIDGGDHDLTDWIVGELHLLLRATLPFAGWRKGDSRRLGRPALDSFPFLARISRASDSGTESDSAAGGNELLPSIIRTLSGSPLLRLLSDIRGIVSASIVDNAYGQLGADVLLAVDKSPASFAALALTEIASEGGTSIAMLSGEDALSAAAWHGAVAERPLGIGALADVFTIPFRSNGKGEWRRLSTPPARDSFPKTAVVDCLRRNADQHVVVVGRSGTGKSTLLGHLAIAADAEINKPNGITIVIDPHGSLAADIANVSPDRVTVLDFGALNPPSFNPLIDPGADPQLIAERFTRDVRESWTGIDENLFGPVWERSTSIAARLELCAPLCSPMGVLRLLRGESDYANTLLGVASEDVRNAWNREVSTFVSSSRDNSQLFLTGKLQPIVANEQTRRIFCGDSTIDVAALIDKGGIIVVSVPESVLGAAGSSMIATALLRRISDHVMTPTRAIGTNPSRVTVIIDEWHKLAQATVQVLLAEGRKFGFELVLANQTFGQLTNPSVVLGTVGTIAAFRCGPIEAAALSAQMLTVSSDELCRLPRHFVAVRDPDGVELVLPSPKPFAMKEAGR